MENEIQQNIKEEKINYSNDSNNYNTNTVNIDTINKEKTSIINQDKNKNTEDITATFDDEKKKKIKENIIEKIKNKKFGDFTEYECTFIQKQCKKCAETLSIIKFKYSPSGVLGRASLCIDCQREKNKQRYKENLKKINKTSKKLLIEHNKNNET